jgi:hypothetical protein
MEFVKNTTLNNFFAKFSENAFYIRAYNIDTNGVDEASIPNEQVDSFVKWMQLKRPEIKVEIINN